MKIRIAGDTVFNNEQKWIERGIFLIPPPKPKPDKLDLVLEMLEKQGGVNAPVRPNETFIINKVWFTRSEAADYLSVSAKTIDRCRLKKDLPYYQVEGTSNIRFKKNDLDNLMH